MKLGIIIPSEEQKSQAGVRIRYERIKPALKDHGYILEFIPIQNLAPTSKPAHDIYLISKCYDARAVLVAQQLRNQGVQVGVDLFDDYFSQLTDSRFVRLRYWLRNLLPHCSFILCSTPGMQEIAKTYSPHLPCHLMNDPAKPFDAANLVKSLVHKLEVANIRRQIEVAWFGMGDNPNFPVGLADLAAFGNEVDRLRGHGFEIHLSILTNQRAMTADNLASIRRLATPYTIKEWTAEREANLLDCSLVSFIPVNAQSFSRVKSLNRAITALTAGTQVLSSGYPLYRPLDQFIYRCPRQLVTNLKQGELAMRPATVDAFLDQIRQLADIETEIKKLTDFFAGLNPVQRSAQSDVIFAVIHGKETLGEVHKFAQKKNMLSVASPLCKLKLNFDVHFQYNQMGGLEVLVSQKKIGMIDKKILPYLDHQAPDANYRVLDVAKVYPDIPRLGCSLTQLDTPASNAAVYQHIMGLVAVILQRIFPRIDWVLSEQSKRIPWSLDMDRAVEVVK